MVRVYQYVHIFILRARIKLKIRCTRTRWHSSIREQNMSAVFYDNWLDPRTVFTLV